MTGLLRCLLLLAGVLVLGAPAPSAVAAEPSAPAVGAWAWPVTGVGERPPQVLAGFDAPALPWGGGHRGVDLAAPPGTPVLAPADGVVTLARDVAGVPVVVVAHGTSRTADELRSTFEAATTTLPVGTLVRRGEPVAVVAGWPSHCDGCLHWGVRRGLDYVDPLARLRRPVRLLPVGPPVRRTPAAGRVSAGAPSAPSPALPDESPSERAGQAGDGDGTDGSDGTEETLLLGAAVATVLAGAGAQRLRQPGGVSRRPRAPR